MVAKTVKPASYMKNAASFIIDFLITLGFMVLLFFTVGEQGIFKAQGYDAKVQEQYQAVVDSGLYDAEKNADGTLKTPSLITYNTIVNATTKVYGYQKYSEEIWNYYTVYLPAHGDAVNGTEAKDYYNAAYLTKTVYGIKDDGTGNAYFTFSKDGSGNYTQPVLLADPQAKVDAGDTTTLENLKYFFYKQSDATASGYIADAVNLLATQSAYTTPANAVSRIIYLSIIPSAIIPPFIFFFIIPICVPNGKTLGKLMLGVAVLGDDGYKAKKIFIILHYFILLLGFELLLIPNLAIGAMLMVLLFIIDFMVLVLSKHHQSLHDRLSKTIVVDARKSVWFATKEAEAEYVKDHPASLAARLADENGGLSEDGSGRKLVSPDAVAAQDSILDLASIEAQRNLIHSDVKFDDLEQGKVSVPASSPTPTKPEETNQAETPAEPAASAKPATPAKAKKPTKSPAKSPKKSTKTESKSSAKKDR